MHDRESASSKYPSFSISKRHETEEEEYYSHEQEQQRQWHPRQLCVRPVCVCAPQPLIVASAPAPLGTSLEHHHIHYSGSQKPGMILHCNTAQTRTLLLRTAAAHHRLLARWTVKLGPGRNLLRMNCHTATWVQFLLHCWGAGDDDAGEDA
jgi:hypothetical protein